MISSIGILVKIFVYLIPQKFLHIREAVLLTLPFVQIEIDEVRTDLYTTSDHEKIITTIFRDFNIRAAGKLR